MSSSRSLLGGAYNVGGSHTNDGVSGGSALGSFILGILNSYSVKTTMLPFYYRWKYIAGYVQDDWKLLPKLTLNVGLRYSVETPGSEKFNRQGFFDDNVEGMLNGVPVKGGFVFAGENGRSTRLWPINWMGFEPRFGLAWTPRPTMTLRASYALLLAPLTGLSGVVVYAISGSSGGVNPGQLNVITNPIGPARVRERRQNQRNARSTSSSTAVTAAITAPMIIAA